MSNGSDTACSGSRHAAVTTPFPSTAAPARPPGAEAARLAPIEWAVSGRGELADQLVVEWHRLGRSPAAISRARALGVTSAAFDDLDGLLRLAGFGTPADPASDAVLARLLRRAADDGFAARVVLQRILPGLIAIAGAERRGGDITAALSEVVGEAWVAIRSYAPTRPTAAIPARLLNDARHRAFTGPRRRRGLVTEHCDVQRVVAPDDQHPFVELTTLLSTVRSGADDAGLDDQLLATMRLLLGHDSVDAAARAAGVTTRSVRYRRSALVARLRSLLADEPTGAGAGVAANTRRGELVGAA